MSMDNRNKPPSKEQLEQVEQPPILNMKSEKWKARWNERYGEEQIEAPPTAEEFATSWLYCLIFPAVI